MTTERGDAAKGHDRVVLASMGSRYRVIRLANLGGPVVQTGFDCANVGQYRLTFGCLSRPDGAVEFAGRLGLAHHHRRTGRDSHDEGTRKAGPKQKKDGTQEG